MLSSAPAGTLPPCTAPAPRGSPRASPPLARGGRATSKGVDATANPHVVSTRHLKVIWKGSLNCLWGWARFQSLGHVADVQFLDPGVVSYRGVIPFGTAASRVPNTKQKLPGVPYNPPNVERPAGAVDQDGSSAMRLQQGPECVSICLAQKNIPFVHFCGGSWESSPAFFRGLSNAQATAKSRGVLICPRCPATLISALR